MGYPVYAEYQQPSSHGSREGPSDWEFRRLKFSVTYNDESLPETTDPDFEIAYVDISSVNLINGITAIEEMTFDEAPSRARRMVQDGDTIISTVRTYLKAIAPIEDPPENMIVSTGFAVIRPLESVNHRFLGYVLQNASFVNEVVANSTGVSYPAINPSKLVCIPFSYPKNSIEQQKIADFLDWKTGQIDGLIAKKKQLIEKLKEKRIALITRAVTKGLNPNVPMRDSGIPWLGDVPAHWEVKKLKFDVSKVGSGVTPKGGAEVYEQTGIPLLRSQNIHFDGFHLDDVVYISQDIHECMSNSQVKTGDVLLNITGASIGRCYFNDGELDEANVNQHVCIIRSESGVLTKFLYYILSSDVGQVQIQLEHGGSGREGLNFLALKNFTIPVMKNDEQQEIVDFLDEKTKQIDALVNKNIQLIERLTEYRTALITAATTGKIDVRNVKVGGPV